MKIRLLDPMTESWCRLERRTYFYHCWIINRMFLVNTNNQDTVQLKLLYLYGAPNED